MPLQTGTATFDTALTSNRLSAVTGLISRSYSYDAAGNTVSDGSRSFGYDDSGRMVSATAGATTAYYAHNGLGERVAKDDGSATTYFVYDEAGHLIGEYDDTGELIQETVWFGDMPIATLRPDGQSGIDVYYVHVDHQNTPRKVTRPGDDEIVWRWDSDPFGETEADEDPDGDQAEFAYNLRFPGQYFDGETGLHYNYFRDYDPVTGRYFQSDPIGLAGGLNTYLYAKANPVAHIDRYGLDTTIAITRDTYTPHSITGTISVTSDRIADTFSGYHLENRNPPNPQLPVPRGSYDAFVDQRSGRKDRIELFNVPNATDVQIHVGNFPNDAEGCFLPGTTRAADFVGNSARAMDSILDIVKRDGGKIRIVVSGPPGVQP